MIILARGDEGCPELPRHDRRCYSHSKRVPVTKFGGPGNMLSCGCSQVAVGQCRWETSSIATTGDQMDTRGLGTPEGGCAAARKPRDKNRTGNLIRQAPVGSGTRSRIGSGLSDKISDQVQRCSSPPTGPVHPTQPIHSLGLPFRRRLTFAEMAPPHIRPLFLLPISLPRSRPQYLICSRPLSPPSISARRVLYCSSPPVSTLAI
ncbi:hypothetical protein BD414DRAFT_38962 [Trametes punicea]|nr:hypothetical protein BD414DRAFT_38962 [Trametes punicea]